MRRKTIQAARLYYLEFLRCVSSNLARHPRLAPRVCRFCVSVERSIAL